jgi:hypothetical protein
VTWLFIIAFVLLSSECGRAARVGPLWTLSAVPTPSRRRCNAHPTPHTQPPHPHPHQGAVGWCAWVFTLVAAAMLAYVNTALVAILRRATAGGAARPLAAQGACWARHRWGRAARRAGAGGGRAGGSARLLLRFAPAGCDGPSNRPLLDNTAPNPNPNPNPTLAAP